ncbi:MAG: LTA synthase family protein [Blautia sp.]|nr:LTA synthase family protein [Blautia sp.]
MNYYELLFHGTVLTIQDIKNAAIAYRQLGSYSFRVTPVVLCILASLIILMIILFYVRMKKIEFMTERRVGVLSIICLIIISYFTVYSPFKLIKSGAWSWELKYYQNSFVIGTMETVGRAFNHITKPDGYDDEIIRNAVGMSGTSENYPDIIMILNESYYDMDHLIDFETDVSCMQNYEALDAFKGYAEVPYTAGGTNASEYELLTSNAMPLLNTSTPFNDLSLKNSKNLVGYLEKIGYTTMAAHPSAPQNYHRESAWSDLGFDYIYFEDDFSDLEYYGERWFASDSSSFQNFKRFYENMPEDQPRFAYLLTIQNHGDWNRNVPEFDIVHIRKDNGLSDYDIGRMEEYLTCVSKTDEMIKEVVDYYTDHDRNVIFYMVGDHSPSLVKEISLEQLETPSSTQINLLMRQVPFFIWSNYGTVIDYSTLSENHNIDLCSLTPLVLKYAGLPISPYYNELIKMTKEVQSVINVKVEENSKNSSLGFIKTDGSSDSISSSSKVAEIVRYYYYMEYNALKSKYRIDDLFDP